MIIAVTGGCGYVGSVLLPRLAEVATSIEILDLKKPQPSLISRLTPPKFRYVPVDLADETQVAKIGNRYDVIIHLAGMVGYPACAKDPEKAYRANVVTTENLMRFKRPNARLILASSTSLYGPQKGRVDESCPIEPTSVYGETKRRAEMIALKDRRSIVYRFASAYGVAPVMRFDNMIHDFVARAVREKFISLYEADFVRQFVHVDDMVGALLHAIAHGDTMGGQVFNVGNHTTELTKRELVGLIRKHFNFTVKFEETARDPELRNYPVSFSKLHEAGFVPSKPLEEAIVDLIHYFEQERKLSHAAG